MLLTYQKFICISQQAIFFYYRMKKLFLLITSCWSSFSSSEPWHSPAGGRFNLPVSNYNTVIGYISIFPYCLARQIRAFSSVLSWSGFRHTDRFRGNGHKLRVFLFSKAGKFKTNMAREPYNELLTNLVSSSRTEKYWPSVVFAQPRCAWSVLPRPRANIPHWVRHSRSVSKRLMIFGLQTS